MTEEGVDVIQKEMRTFEPGLRARKAHTLCHSRVRHSSLPHPG